MYEIRAFKKNEGICVKLENFSIDLIVREIGGTKRYRETDIEIRRHTSRRNLHLEGHDLHTLIHDFKFGIVKLKEGRQHPSNAVTLYCQYKKNFQVSYKAY